MNFAMYLILVLAVTTVVAGSVVYGYYLAMRDVKKEHERRLKERLKLKQKADTPIYDELYAKFYDVD